jgi:site-specific recombinase XerD
VPLRIIEYAFLAKETKNSALNNPGALEKLIEHKTKQIASAITRTRNLTVEDLKTLDLPLKFQENLVIIEKSTNDWKLKTPIAIELDKVLAAGEKGLVDFIIRSCIQEQPVLIPYIFENKTLLKLARHFLRDCSKSLNSCRSYTAGVKKYATWLAYTPDQIIDDVKPVGAIPDPLRVQSHCGFLNDYLADLQDAGLSAGAVSNCIKAAKTFYHINGAKKVELELKLSRKVKNKDRAPQPEEIAMMLDKSATREGFIVAAFTTGGFREGTLSKLKYRHVKDDLEANRFPIHVHVEAEITKGKYHDYDTFLNIEACQLLKLYIQERRQGGRSMSPEDIADDAPLIRNSHITSRVLGLSEKQLRKIIHDLAVQTKIAKKLPDSWMYSVRCHSLRKFFRTQMGAAKLDSEVIEYMMGHTISTYDDIQSLGIETLRKAYSAANLAIRPKTQLNRIEQLKEIIRGWGENPEELLTKDALVRGNITETTEQYQSHQLSILAEQLKQAIRREVTQ